MAKRKRLKSESNNQSSLLTWDTVPSAQTMRRSHLLSAEANELISRAVRASSRQAVERDQLILARVEQADTPEALLDLAPLATGMIEAPWRRRIRSFGPTILPKIVDRLRRARNLQGYARSAAYERLAGALYDQGTAGANALLSCFDDLDDYGKSIACVVLGLLRSQESAEVIWAFYQRIHDTPGESFYIGALWGLIDLQDPRAADALEELLWTDHPFYEAFAMAYKAGDERVVLPLMYVFAQGTEKAKDGASHALAAVAQRIGRDAFLEAHSALEKEAGIPSERLRALVDRLLARSPAAAEAYFSVFYQGIDPQTIEPGDIQATLDRLHRIEAQVDTASEPSLPPPATERPGRNDPCWCGSGIKYKHCHWRQDRRRT